MGSTRPPPCHFFFKSHFEPCHRIASIDKILLSTYHLYGKPAGIQMERFIPVECFRKKLIPSLPSPNSRKFLYYLFRTSQVISKKTAMPKMADSRDESLPFQTVCYVTAVFLASPLITDFATHLWHSR